ncbi:MAG: hypothetical protein II719_06090 [Clostridia bacterium]|nr:hypothetical protein [Clostridia bacterium]
MKTTKKAVRERNGLLFAILLPLASGILFSLPLCLPSLWFLTWVAAAPMYLALRRSADEKRPVRALLSGLIYGFSFSAVSYHWIPFFLRETDGSYPTGWIPAGVFAVLCLSVAAVHGAASFLLSVLGGRFVTPKQPFAFAVLCSCTGLAAECLTAMAAFGFSEFDLPWNRIAMAFANVPAFLQTVPFLGSLFLSGFAILIGCLLGEGLRKKKKTALRLIPVGTALLLVFACFGFGQLCLDLPGVKGLPVRAAVWPADGSAPSGTTAEQIRKESEQAPSDLILVPSFSDSFPSSEETAQLAFDTGSVLIVREPEEDSERPVSTFRAVTPDGTRIDCASVSDRSGVLPETESGSVGILTEKALFRSRDIVRTVRCGADLLYAIFPDRRLNGTVAAGQLHSSAVLTAAESGRDLILQTPDGTALYSRRGYLISQSDSGGVALCTVSRYTDRTLFSRFGENISLGIAAIGFVLTLLTSVFRKKIRKRRKAKKAG